MSPSSGEPGLLNRMFLSISPSDEPNSPICTPFSSVPVTTITAPSTSLVVPSPISAPSNFVAIGWTSMIVFEYSSYLSGVMISSFISITSFSEPIAFFIKLSSIVITPSSTLVSSPSLTSLILTISLFNTFFLMSASLTASAAFPSTSDGFATKRSLSFEETWLAPFWAADNGISRLMFLPSPMWILTTPLPNFGATAFPACVFKAAFAWFADAVSVSALSSSTTSL